jgi:hypothetical protein
MKEIKASIILKNPANKILPNPVKSGLRPSFSFNGQLVACEIRSESGAEWLPLNEEIKVRIQLLYGEELAWTIEAGRSFELNVASQVIGKGTVLNS